jgi:hypothetical protein
MKRRLLIVLMGLGLAGCGDDSNTPSENGQDGGTSDQTTDLALAQDGAILADRPQPPPDVVSEPGVVPPPVECGTPVGVSYFVGPSGDDTNAGTQAAPWKTFRKAAASVQPGDAIYILPGRYSEALVPQNSGTEGKYILFAAADPDSLPILDGAGAKEDRISIDQINYLKLCNLVVLNSTQYGVKVGGGNHINLLGIAVENAGEAAIYLEGTEDLVVDGCHTRSSVSSGIGVWYCKRAAVRHNKVVNACGDADKSHEESISISGTEDFEVSDNEIWFDTTPVETGSAAIKIKESCQRGKVFNNYAHDFPEGSIGLDAWEAGLAGTPTLNTIDIYNNRIERAGGIRVSSEELGIVENINIYNNLLLHTNNGIMITHSAKNGPKNNVSISNNTIYEGAPDGWGGIWIVTENFTNAVIRNNIVVSNDWSMGKITLGYASRLSEVIVDHNLVLGPKNGIEGFPDAVELSDQPGNSTADPAFVNAAAGDLHLLAGSPAIDQGAAIAIVTTDFDSVSRPQGAAYDIGAFEYKP